MSEDIVRVLYRHCSQKMLAGQYDGVVAMYHDQHLRSPGFTAEPETRSLRSAEVNVTLGLPIRTDQENAFDIAGTGKANEKVRLMPSSWRQ